MARFVPRTILQQRPREDWATDTQTRHRALTQHTKEDARLGLLRMIRSLPYGGSIFFTVKRIEDPIGLLPGRIILGEGRRGVRFNSYAHTRTSLSNRRFEVKRSYARGRVVETVGASDRT